MTDAFERLLSSHRTRLRLHCYRMLGSAFDADDMVQETFIRALRSKETLEDEGKVRPWLFRIATNVCLTELAKRPRRARGPELGPPADPDAELASATSPMEWLEPCPSAWLGEADPAAQYSLKESVALAFVAALQVLTPSQRAVLLLRDVVGLSAEETAAVLESSVSSANSALHRAREALSARVGRVSEWSPDANAPVDRALLERYLAVWEQRNLDAIVALLHEDVILSMPPLPIWISGRKDVARFFAHRVSTALEQHLFRAVALEANGGPAAGFYRVRDDGYAYFFALQVLESRDGLLRTVDHFMGASAHAAFFAGGLPERISATG